MKLAVYIGKQGIEQDNRLISMLGSLVSGGMETYTVDSDEVIHDHTDMILSVGGDGTFLSASALAVGKGLPVLGVNLGRIGFLSENRPEDIPEALLKGEYAVENRSVLKAELEERGGEESSLWPYAFNEFTIHRSGAAMVGIDVTIDGVNLPTYWADGMIVSTSSGSTAYSLSVGGPIVLPESKVLIITPIAPHNLNIRPLVVPDNAEIFLKVQSRDGGVTFTADNRSVNVSDDMKVKISLAQFSLKRIRLKRSDFINALTEKLYWGEDMRNIR